MLGTTDLGLTADSAGSSRRNILKRNRKLCHYCKKIVNYVIAESDPNTSDNYNFCSTHCLQQYKAEIFMRETLACLQKNQCQSDEEDLSSCTVKHPKIEPESVDTDDEDVDMAMASTSQVPDPARETGRQTETSNKHNKHASKSSQNRTLSCESLNRHRRRLQRYRPHPSYRLNKRYWDRLRTANAVAGTVPLPSSSSRHPSSPKTTPSKQPVSSSSNDSSFSASKTHASSVHSPRAFVAPPPLTSITSPTRLSSSDSVSYPANPQSLIIHHAFLRSGIHQPPPPPPPPPFNLRHPVLHALMPRMHGLHHHLQHQQFLMHGGGMRPLSYPPVFVPVPIPIPIPLLVEPEFIKKMMDRQNKNNADDLALD